MPAAVVVVVVMMAVVIAAGPFWVKSPIPIQPALSPSLSVLDLTQIPASLPLQSPA